MQNQCRLGHLLSKYSHIVKHCEIVNLKRKMLKLLKGKMKISSFS